jgi:hypothetical protein
MDGRRLAWLLAKAKLHLITSPSSSSRLKKSESRGGVNSASLIDADGRQPDRDRGRPLVSQKKERNNIRWESRCPPGKTASCSTAAFLVQVQRLRAAGDGNGRTGMRSAYEADRLLIGRGHESDLDHKSRAWILQ